MGEQRISDMVAAFMKYGWPMLEATLGQVIKRVARIKYKKEINKMKSILIQREVQYGG